MADTQLGVDLDENDELGLNVTMSDDRLTQQGRVHKVSELIMSWRHGRIKCSLDTEGLYIALCG